MANGHGGQRPGAGRPEGAKGKRTVTRERAHALLALLEDVALDPNQTAETRVAAAVGALPYLIAGELPADEFDPAASCAPAREDLSKPAIAPAVGWHRLGAKETK